MIIVEVSWLILGVVWLFEYYMAVDPGEAREVMLGKYYSLSYYKIEKY